MAKTLRLKFKTDSDASWALSLRYPKNGITLAEATTAANAVITAGIFVKNPQTFAGAEVVDRTVTEIIV
jgi:hypothetical protein